MLYIYIYTHTHIIYVYTFYGHLTVDLRRMGLLVSTSDGGRRERERYVLAMPVEYRILSHRMHKEIVNAVLGSLGLGVGDALVDVVVREREGERERGREGERGREKDRQTERQKDGPAGTLGTLPGWHSDHDMQHATLTAKTQ